MAVQSKMAWSKYIDYNSTFYENQARSGGAIHHNDSLTVTNSTFVGNVSTASSGSAIRTHSGNLFLRNSIFSGNSGGDACDPYQPGYIRQSVNNYVDDGTCKATYSSDDGPINLGALTGSPAYYPLLAGSAAIDAADSNYCPTTDQAGTARPIGNACDIGAHETTAEPPTATATATTTPTATSTLGSQGQRQEATDTPAPPISSQGVYGLTLASNSAGELQVSWMPPGSRPTPIASTGRKLARPSRPGPPATAMPSRLARPTP